MVGLELGLHFGGAHRICCRRLFNSNSSATSAALVIGEGMHSAACHSSLILCKLLVLTTSKLIVTAQLFDEFQLLVMSAMLHLTLAVCHLCV